MYNISIYRYDILQWFSITFSIKNGGPWWVAVFWYPLIMNSKPVHLQMLGAHPRTGSTVGSECLEYIQVLISKPSTIVDGHQPKVVDSRWYGWLKKSCRQALGFAHPPTIGFLTNQLLGILPTSYWVSYQPTYNIPSINFFHPPWQPMRLMIQVQVQHSFCQFFSPPLATHV